MYNQDKGVQELYVSDGDHECVFSGNLISGLITGRE